MATLADNVVELAAQVTELKAAVAAIASPTVDLSPVLSAVAAVQATVNDIDVQVKPTSAA